MYATLDAMALAILVQEWRSSGRINKYTWIGVGWIVLQQGVHAAIIGTAFFTGIVQWLGSLAYYR
jgi:hypothetical protein